MILDSSAIVAVIYAEPEQESFLRAMQAADSLAVGAPSALESAMVLGHDSLPLLRSFFAGMSIEVVSFGTAHLPVAHEAFARYGKRRGSMANLNFGDCMSYALAKVAGEPLLFKGDDFTHTDITPAV